jgi:hypothetical protein
MTELVRNADDLPLPEPAAHMYPSDLDRFQTNETFATAYSVAVGNPDERSVPLISLSDCVAYAAAEVAKERERWEAAMKQAWSMIDPFNPAGVPGSYARGQDSGIVAALTTVRANYVAAAAIRSAAPPQCTDQPSEPQ